MASVTFPNGNQVVQGQFLRFQLSGFWPNALFTVKLAILGTSNPSQSAQFTTNSTGDGLFQFVVDPLLVNGTYTLFVLQFVTTPSGFREFSTEGTVIVGPPAGGGGLPGDPLGMILAAVVLLPFIFAGFEWARRLKRG